jgi:hypothetical protein
MPDHLSNEIGNALLHQFSHQIVGSLAEASHPDLQMNTRLMRHQVGLIIARSFAVVNHSFSRLQNSHPWFLFAFLIHSLTLYSFVSLPYPYFAFTR